jgi:uncharacterized protein with HEPN domain
MIEAAENIVTWTAGLTREEFLADAQLRSAVAMQIVIVGEGARLLSVSIKGQAAQLPWHDLINMRHRLAHGYARASAIILQDTAANWVPQLLPTLHALLASTDGEEP